LKGNHQGADRSRVKQCFAESAHLVQMRQTGLASKDQIGWASVSLFNRKTV
jgi:hypothetical protein